MHEHSIAMSIIKIADDEMNKQNIQEPVEKITFLAGVMHAVIPDSLQFHFDIARKDHQFLKDTILNIIKIPVHTVCSHCGREDTLEEAVFVCTDCFTPLTIKSGQELRVESIEFAD